MAEFLSVLSSGGEGKVDVLKAISVDVENWGVYRFGEIRGIHTTPALGGNCGEANLVVYYDVDCSPHCVVLQVGHLNCFVNHALASEGSVTVNQKGNVSHSLVGLLEGSLHVVFGSDSAKHHRVYALQMRGVCQNFAGKLTTIRIGSGK